MYRGGFKLTFAAAPGQSDSVAVGINGKFSKQTEWIQAGSMSTGLTLPQNLKGEDHES